MKGWEQAGLSRDKRDGRQVDKFLYWERKPRKKEFKQMVEDSENFLVRNSLFSWNEPKINRFFFTKNEVRWPGVGEEMSFFGSFHKIPLKLFRA